MTHASHPLRFCLLVCLVGPFASACSSAGDPGKQVSGPTGGGGGGEGTLGGMAGAGTQTGGEGEQKVCMSLEAGKFEMVDEAGPAQAGTWSGTVVHLSRRPVVDDAGVAWPNAGVWTEVQDGPASAATIELRAHGPIMRSTLNLDDPECRAFRYTDVSLELKVPGMVRATMTGILHYMRDDSGWIYVSARVERDAGVVPQQDAGPTYVDKDGGVAYPDTDGGVDPGAVDTWVSLWTEGDRLQGWLHWPNAAGEVQTFSADLRKQ